LSRSFVVVVVVVVVVNSYFSSPALSVQDYA
jgi:hypothetical protein